MLTDLPHIEIGRMKLKWILFVLGITALSVAGYFFLTNKRQTFSPTIIKIVIQNGQYVPNLISAKAGQPIKLQFLREDHSGCSEIVRFPKLDVAAELPYNKLVDVTLPPQKPGIYEFTCKGSKYQGRLTVF